MKEGYKKTEVGIIPEDWELKTIDDVAFINPEALKNSTNKELLINYIDIESVKTRKILGTKNYTFGEAPSRARRIVKVGDVIVSTVRPNLKSVAIIKNNIENLVCSTGFAVLRNKENLCSKFLYQFSLSDIFTEQLVNKTVGSNYPAVNTSDVKTTYIILPPLKEQEKIAEILSTIDSQIDDTEKLIEKSKELKKGLMQKLLTKGIGHSEFKDTQFGIIPNDWNTKKIGDIYNDLKAGSTPSRAKAEFFTGDIPWITSGELKNKYISKTYENITSEAVEDAKLKIYPPGTFFIAITGLEAQGTRGSCGINSVYATTNQSCLAFLEKDEIYPEFLYYWYLLHGEYIGTKYTQGTKQQSLNNKIVEEFEIGYPNKEEQYEIVQILSSVDYKIEGYENKKQKLEELKKGLMQQLLTGKVRSI